MGVQPKKSSRLFILLGVALTILSMLGVYAIAQSTSNSASKGTVQVLVAKQEIPAHTIFATPSDVSTWLQPVSLPVASKPQGSFADAASFESSMLSGTKQATSETIYANEPVLAGMFSNIGNTRTGYTLAFQLPKGHVAVSFEVPIVDESAGAVAVGDSIDLMASYMAGAGSGPRDTGNGLSAHQTQTQFVFEDLKVLALGQLSPGGTAGSSSSTSSGATGSQMITVSLPTEKALLLQHMKDFAGDWLMSVVLRSALDHKRTATTPVEHDWFFSHLFTNFN